MTFWLRKLAGLGVGTASGCGWGCCFLCTWWICMEIACSVAVELSWVEQLLFALALALSAVCWWYSWFLWLLKVSTTVQIMALSTFFFRISLKRFCELDFNYTKAVREVLAFRKRCKFVNKSHRNWWKISVLYYEFLLFAFPCLYLYLILYSFCFFLHGCFISFTFCLFAKASKGFGFLKLLIAAFYPGIHLPLDVFNICLINFTFFLCYLNLCTRKVNANFHFDIAISWERSSILYKAF